jgi:caffeic acid 3-O-methyltransferase
MLAGLDCSQSIMLLMKSKEIMDILQWILRDWDYEHCLKLLKNCYMSVPVDGKIIVVEQILPTFAEISAVSKDKCQLDKVSLTQTPGGKERMQGHLRNLAISAGFKDIIHVSYVYHYSVMEFLKWMISLPF